MHKTMPCVTRWHAECKLLQKLPGALPHLHVFLRRRTQTRSSPDFGCLSIYLWHLRWYEMLCFGFFFPQWCKILLSLILQKKNTKRDHRPRGHELWQWGTLVTPSHATQLLIEPAENLRERAEGEEVMSQYGANSKPSVFTNKLNNGVRFNYCPIHLQPADLSLCLSPWDADSCQRRLGALLLLFPCIAVIYVGQTKIYS